MFNITTFLYENEMIDIDILKKEVLKTTRCKRKDQMKTKSISVQRLLRLMNQYKNG